VTTQQSQPISANVSYSHAGWWQLSAVFVLALLLFLLLRWQPEPWLRGQLRAATEPYGIAFDYQQLETDGLAIHLHDVRISGGSLPAPQLFDSIRLAPAWMSLLQAKPAAYVYLIWQGIEATATVLQNDQVVVLADIHATSDAADLPALLKLSVPVQLGGQLLVSGDIHLDMVSGRPLNGALHGQWQQAAAGLFGAPELLGDYALTLNNEDPAKAWQWQLGGGTGVVLNGHGTLTTTQASLPQRWMIDGQLDVIGGESTPASLQPMLRQPLHFTLAGPLATLRLQPR